MQPDTAQLPEPAIDPNDVFDIKDWVMENFQLNDPIELRRDLLRNEAKAYGCTDVAVRNLGNIDGWEMRFNRAANECGNAAKAENLLHHIIYFSGLQFDPARFVAIVDGDRVAARFWLKPDSIVPPQI